MDGLEDHDMQTPMMSLLIAVHAGHVLMRNARDRILHSTILSLFSDLFHESFSCQGAKRGIN